VPINKVQEKPSCCGMRVDGITFARLLRQHLTQGCRVCSQFRIHRCRRAMALEDASSPACATTTKIRTAQRPPATRKRLLHKNLTQQHPHVQPRRLAANMRTQAVLACHCAAVLGRLGKHGEALALLETSSLHLSSYMRQRSLSTCASVLPPQKTF
jgi:hypothetical protein